jgi:hypothetical protein
MREQVWQYLMTKHQKASRWGELDVRTSSMGNSNSGSSSSTGSEDETYGILSPSMWLHTTKRVLKRLAIRFGKKLGPIFEAKLRNPCTHLGHIESYEDYIDSSSRSDSDSDISLYAMYSVVGTGQPDECIEVLRHVLWPQRYDQDEDGADDMAHHCSSNGCPVHDVHHPSVSQVSPNDSRRRQYYAMSVYYYALDCIRVFATEKFKLHHWPKPTISELQKAAKSFCNVPWNNAEKHYLGQHEYTTNEQFPYRCMEGLYLTMLLDEAFGFDRESRDITLALNVQGIEVEWTLGYALAELIPMFQSSDNKIKGKL